MEVGGSIWSLVQSKNAGVGGRVRLAAVEDLKVHLHGLASLITTYLEPYLIRWYEIVTL